MWIKSKSDVQNSNSWEEQAFAEDAAGPLGGFVWPPRSYSCSFCKREFRSAQALGGHMNVHRRDRARLKQLVSLSPQLDQVILHHQDPNPKPNPNPSLVSSPPSPSRVSLSTISTLENFVGHACVPPLSSPSSWSDSKPACTKTTREEESLRLWDDDSVETNLSVGLNLAVSGYRPSGEDSDEVSHNCKRHKTSVHPLPVCSDDRYPFKYPSKVLGLKTGSTEEIDLELRLGA
ncbi:hypothetical protein RJ639_036717 [Escallonia herrerae]|uniref:C2H2-type domain-containing protein n=1 Tax=Escallonia herrerae TaxID=1293975 RepID=A0AA89BHD2_9ASTE|nr:hypothetical protein RJ639_036717 [Escallonia herrerae]